MLHLNFTSFMRLNVTALKERRAALSQFVKRVTAAGHGHLFEGMPPLGYVANKSKLREILAPYLALEVTQLSEVRISNQERGSEASDLSSFIHFGEAWLMNGDNIYDPAHWSQREALMMITDQSPPVESEIHSTYLLKQTYHCQLKHMQHHQLKHQF